MRDQIFRCDFNKLFDDKLRLSIHNHTCLVDLVTLIKQSLRIMSKRVYFVGYLITC